MSDQLENNGQPSLNEGQPPVDTQDSDGGRRSWVEKLAERTQLVMYAVLVLAGIVVLNLVISKKYDKSWDLTKTKRYSLSAESIKVVQGLNQPLDLIYFARQEEFQRARDLLSRYERASKKVDVQYVDPDRHPDQARLYGIQTYGTTVVKSGDRKELVSNLTEEDLTNAMVRVLKGGKKNVYFVEGEGERDPNDSGRNGYSELKRALEAENFTVNTLVLAQNPKIPADCAILVVAGPKKDMVAPETQAIADYLEHGGHVMFLVNPETSGPLVDYLEKTLNVKLTRDVVVDTSGIGRLFGASELMPIVAHYDSHPITSEMSNLATLFPFARTVESGSAKDAKATVTPLLETTPASFAPNYTGSTEIRLDPKNAKRGPLTLGVAGTMTGSSKAGDEGRFVVYGSPDFAINSIIGFNGNKDLFINSLNWLSTQEKFISIRPKPPESTPLSLSARQMSVVLWSTLIALPGLIVLSGVAVWWRRRSA
jgi:ABC-type uncharacterized transport system involved in gliding motility auxiliary subunit